MKKERYVQLVKGNYYWRPTKKMRTAGFSPEPLGDSLAAANARARWLNGEWDEARKLAKADPLNVEKGDFNWLMEEFQNDPVWYRKKAPVTRYEIDLAFERISKAADESGGETVGEVSVKVFARRHGRALYNNMRKHYSVSASEKIMKWFRRLMAYAVERGVRDDIPIDRLEVEHPDPRDAVWAAEEIEAVFEAAMFGGKASSGNEIPPRRSVALAIAIAYDTSMPQGDILRLTWDKWDGQGFTILQQKKRSNRLLYLPVSDRTRELLNTMVKAGTHIIVCEQTGKPFVDAKETSSQNRRNAFGRLFRKFCKRVEVEGKTFHDIRRTALTQMGNSGATNAEITSQSGHAIGSKILDVYVKPDKNAAMNLAAKRWGKRDD